MAEAGRQGASDGRVSGRCARGREHSGGPVSYTHLDVYKRQTYTYLFNFDIGTALDIPLTYQKDMIVYNTDKISGYTFTGTPYFFDILSLEPAE